MAPHGIILSPVNTNDATDALETALAELAFRGVGDATATETTALEMLAAILGGAPVPADVGAMVDAVNALYPAAAVSA